MDPVQLVLKRKPGLGPDLLITSTGDVTLRAGEAIHLYDGLTIETGAAVRFELSLEE